MKNCAKRMVQDHLRDSRCERTWRMDWYVGKRELGRCVLTPRALRRFVPLPFRARPERAYTDLTRSDDVRVPSEHPIVLSSGGGATLALEGV